MRIFAAGLGIERAGFAAEALCKKQTKSYRSTRASFEKDLSSGVKLQFDCVADSFLNDFKLCKIRLLNSRGNFNLE